MQAFQFHIMDDITPGLDLLKLRILNQIICPDLATRKDKRAIFLNTGVEKDLCVYQLVRLFCPFLINDNDPGDIRCSFFFCCRYFFCRFILYIQFCHLSNPFVISGRYHTKQDIPASI